MTLSFSWWHGAFVHFIANSSGEMHFKSLLKLARGWYWFERYGLLWIPAGQAILCKLCYLLAPSRMRATTPCFLLLTFLILFCHTSLPDPLCPLHSPIRVLLKVEISCYWSVTARLQGPFCVSLKFHSFKSSSSSFSTPQTGPTPQYWHPDIAKVPNFPGVELFVLLLFFRPSFPSEGKDVQAVETDLPLLWFFWCERPAWIAPHVGIRDFHTMPSPATGLAPFSWGIYLSLQYFSSINVENRRHWKSLLDIAWCVKTALALQVTEKPPFNPTRRHSKHLLDPTHKMIHFLISHCASTGSKCWSLEGQPLPLVFSLLSSADFWSRRDFLPPAQCRALPLLAVAVSTGISTCVVVEMEVTRLTFFFHQKTQSMCHWHIVAGFSWPGKGSVTAVVSVLENKRCSCNCSDHWPLLQMPTDPFPCCTSPPALAAAAFLAHKEHKWLQML